jgi:hypothetical protein
MATLLECAACCQTYVAPTEAIAEALRCPWCGAEPSAAAPDNAAAADVAFPDLGPAIVRRKRSRTPPLMWLAIGTALGACVVLLAIAVAAPGVFKRSSQSAPTDTVVMHPQSPIERAREPLLVRTQPSLPITQKQASETRAIEAVASQLEMVRQVVRDEIRRAEGPPPRMAAARDAETRRLIRSMPRGTMDDVATGLGLTIPERLTHRPTPSVAETAEPAETEKPQQAVAVRDDAAALAALAKAGIRCDKDPATGLVHRVDGSFRMTDAQLASVAKLPGVTDLKLSYSEVTDAGLESIQKCTSLVELSLNGTKITDAGLAHLTALENLEKLDLEKTAVSDAGVDVLAGLKRLQQLDLRHTKIGPAAIETLKKALADVRIRG